MAKDVQLSDFGSQFTVDGHKFSLNVPGLHNVSNALAAIGAARSLGVPDNFIMDALRSSPEYSVGSTSSARQKASR